MRLLRGQVHAFLAAASVLSLIGAEEAIPRFSVQYRGARLQLMQLASGEIFVEPLVAYEANGGCPAVIQFDYLTNDYSLTLPLLVDSAGHPGASAFVLRDLTCQSMMDGGDVRAAGRLEDRVAGGARLRFHCASFARCEQIRWTLAANPAALADFVQLSLTGGVADRLVSLSNRPVRVLASAAAACGSTWTVFQRRIDASLSFRQNWATYVRGFGHPDSNYWMGLEQLSARTAGSLFYANCRLRIEVQTVTGLSLWGEWAGLKVQDASESYRLNVTGPDSASTLDPGRSLVNENNATFSAFDNGGSNSGILCSKQHAGAGWWFNSCFSILLNGLFTDGPVLYDNHNVNQVNQFGTWLQITTTKMMFKCI